MKKLFLFNFISCCLRAPIVTANLATVVTIFGDFWIVQFIYTICKEEVKRADGTWEGKGQKMPDPDPNFCNIYTGPFLV